MTLDGQSRTAPSGDSGITFGVPNGTYDFQASALGYAAYPSSGAVVIQGQSITEVVVFGAPGSLFNVTFDASHLPPATSWSVTLQGNLQASTQSSINFALVSNGSYEFTTSTASPSWQTTLQAGATTVNGSDVEVSVPFEYAYPVELEAGGLLAGEQWYVNVTGDLAAAAGHSAAAASSALVNYTYTSDTPDLTFSLSNGSYSYTVGSRTVGWAPSVANHSLTIHGASPPVQSIQPMGAGGGTNGLGPFLTWALAMGAAVVLIAVVAVGYRAYALRPAPQSGPDAVDELYVSYELPTEADPATVDGNPDALNDIF